MSTTDRQQFLDRLRHALADHHGDPDVAPLTPADYEQARLTPSSTTPAGLAERFTEMASDAGMIVHPVASTADLTSQLTSLLDELSISTLLLPHDPLLDSLALRGQLAQRADLTLLDLPADRETLTEAAFNADAALSVATYALAETGSLVLTASADTPRLLSLAPPVHLCLLPVSRLLGDLLDLLALYDASALPPSVTLVTGPSKTADIEMTLVQGAHGPIAEHILLLSNQEHTE